MLVKDVCGRIDWVIKPLASGTKMRRILGYIYTVWLGGQFFEVLAPI